MRPIAAASLSAAAAIVTTSELGDLRGYTRDLMSQLEVDLETRLDWVAVDHWNTDNPHIHVLVRGATADGTDLVVDRGYMAEGVRGRASEIATLELGPRSELQVDAALRREVEAERWTSLDAELARRSRENEIVDLRPVAGGEALCHEHRGNPVGQRREFGKADVPVRCVEEGLGAVGMGGEHAVIEVVAHRRYGSRYVRNSVQVETVI